MRRLLARWMNRRGAACHAAGDHRRAVAYFTRALTWNPELDDARYNLGLTLYALGDLEEAETALQGYLERQQASADAWNALALVAIAQGKKECAQGCLFRAIELAPGETMPRANLGQLLAELRRWEEARGQFVWLVAHQPENAENHLGLARILLELGRNEEALACLDHAITLTPENVSASLMAGNAWIGMGRYDEGEHCFVAALGRVPESLEVRGSLATLHLEMGEYPEAKRLFDSADFGLSGMAVRRALAMPMFPDEAEIWEPARVRCLQSLDRLQTRGLRLTRPDLEVGTTNFRFAYHGLDDRSLHQHIAAFYRAVCPDLNWVAPHVGTNPRRGRLKLGVVSACLLAEHSVGRIFGGMIESLSPDYFETTLFHVGRQVSGHRYVGEGRLRSLHLPQDLKTVREAIAAEQLDILLYTDIGMDALTYFLAYSRLARLQAVFAGHPDTTGIDSIDCFLSFRGIEPAASAAHYSERLVLLDDCPVVYPAYRPGRQYTRGDFGLQDNARIYACLQTPFKFHPDFDLALAEILERDAAGYIVIAESPWPRQCRVLTERLRRVLPENGKRLVVLPQLKFDQYLGLLDCCDVLLDTWHFGGGNTIFHGFAAGVPTITWPGEFMRGRVATWIYGDLESEEFIAAQRQDYATLAVAVAEDEDHRRNFAATMQARGAEVFERAAGVAQLERFLLAYHSCR